MQYQLLQESKVRDKIYENVRSMQSSHDRTIKQDFNFFVGPSEQLNSNEARSPLIVMTPTKVFRAPIGTAVRSPITLGQLEKYLERRTPTVRSKLSISERVRLKRNREQRFSEFIKQFESEDQINSSNNNKLTIDEKS